jgi:hypothetical protein
VVDKGPDRCVVEVRNGNNQQSISDLRCPSQRMDPREGDTGSITATGCDGESQVAMNLNTSARALVIPPRSDKTLLKRSVGLGLVAPREEKSR